MTLGKSLTSCCKRIPVLASAIEVLEKIHAPAPLHDFEDYEAYWEQRRGQDKQDKNVLGLHRNRVITDSIPDGASVLDIGCGDGAFLSYLLSRRPGARVLGVDISSRAIERARGRGIHCKVIDPDAPLGAQIEGSFDYVVMMEVIEHIQDAETLVRQVKHMQPVRLFITIPNLGYFMHRLRLMFGGRMPVTFIILHMKEHVRFWTVKDFHQWADVMGFEVCNYRGQLRSNRMGMKTLIRRWPSLFAAQMIYELKIKT